LFTSGIIPFRVGLVALGGRKMGGLNGLGAGVYSLSAPMWVAQRKMMVVTVTQV
jgi:hypothetical protein